MGGFGTDIFGIWGISGTEIFGISGTEISGSENDSVFGSSVEGGGGTLGGSGFLGFDADGSSPVILDFI